MFRAILKLLVQDCPKTLPKLVIQAKVFENLKLVVQMFSGLPEHVPKSVIQVKF
jgi:hypothetical protein